jgi:hypothetical protein
MNPGGGIGSGGSFRVIPIPPRAVFRGGRSRIFTRGFFAPDFFAPCGIPLFGTCILIRRPMRKRKIRNRALITKSPAARINLYFLEWEFALRRTRPVLILSLRFFDPRDQKFPGL